jgi:hypothetical protein
MAFATATKISLEDRVSKVIEEALELADLGDLYIPAHKVAARVFETETDLIAEVARPWIVERLTWMISRRRGARRTEKYPSEQMVLPDPIFQGLPKTIFLRNGERPRLDYATLTETEDHLKLLRERFKTNARVTQFEALVELHRKWAAVYRGITWTDAKRREAEQREKG